MSANIIIGGNTLNNINSIDVRDADHSGQYISFTTGGIVLTPITLTASGEPLCLTWQATSGANGYYIILTVNGTTYKQFYEEPTSINLDEIMQNASYSAVGYAVGFSGVSNTVEGTTTCLCEGTLVYTPDGLIPIENLSDNTAVYTYNFETKSIEVDEVEKWRLTNGAADICKITFENGNYIECTPQHAFYTDTDWKCYEPNEHTVIKDALNIGDNVLEVNGNYTAISSIEKYDKPQPVYNLKLKNGNSFFVTGNEKFAPVLVEHLNIEKAAKLSNQFFSY